MTNAENEERTHHQLTSIQHKTKYGSPGSKQARAESKTP